MKVNCHGSSLTDEDRVFSTKILINIPDHPVKFGSVQKCIWLVVFIGGLGVGRLFILQIVREAAQGGAFG